METSEEKKDQIDKPITNLYKEPRGEESQRAVLTIKSVVIGVEGKVVQVEESAKIKQQKLLS